MAGPTGLEPATSGVTGRRSNRLNYDPVCTLSAAPPTTRGAKTVRILTTSPFGLQPFRGRNCASLPQSGDWCLLPGPGYSASRNRAGSIVARFGGMATGNSICGRMSFTGSIPGATSINSSPS